MTHRMHGKCACPPRPGLRFLAVAALVAAVGCRGDSVATDYGSTRLGAGRASLNGVDVFADLLQQNDCDTTFRWRLSPRTGENADVIVWFPSGLEPPSPEVVEWFDNWLAEDVERLLVYVGRDYDAAPSYWEMCERKLPADRGRYGVRKVKARDDWDRIARQADLAGADPALGDWFAWEQGEEHHPGIIWGPWAEGVSSREVELFLRSAPVPPPDARVLLDSESGVIAFEIPLRGWSDPQIVAIANGAFLLNYPLINPVHRQLAGKVIDRIGPGRRVAVLLSEPGGPPVLEEDPKVTAQTGWELFAIQPIGWVLLHAAAVGIAYAFSRSAAFGRPRRERPERLHDFGRHLDAAGELVAACDDPTAIASAIEAGREALADSRWR